VEPYKIKRWKIAEFYQEQLVIKIPSLPKVQRGVKQRLVFLRGYQSFQTIDHGALF
jgi:hypothetical protein